MGYGLNTVGNIALGVAGVAVLSTSANTVAIIAEVVRRAISAGYDWARGITTDPRAKDEWIVRDFTPYSAKKDWQSLGIAGIKNIVVGTAALYVAHRFCPSLVTSANSLLHYVVGIQFTPHYIPLTKLAGL